MIQELIYQISDYFCNLYEVAWRWEPAIEDNEEILRRVSEILPRIDAGIAEKVSRFFETINSIFSNNRGEAVDVRDQMIDELKKFVD